MTHYHVAIIPPEGHVHSYCFSEVAEALCSGLRRLGHFVDQGENTIDALATNIVLGAHLLTEEDAKLLPPTTIIFNLEQIGGAKLPDWYAGLAARHRIWDYSALNLRHWNLLPCVYQPVLMEIGFAPELRRIVSAPAQDIDVLFYGSINDRRNAVLNALRDAGLQAAAVCGIYGSQRDALIARAKVVLNVHYYGTELIEMVRISYLLANAKAVVSESAPDLDNLKEAIIACPYEKLVERCVALVRDEAARSALERKGAAWFERRDQAAILEKVLSAGRQDFSQNSIGTKGTFPRSLNLGSGKDWREECLNVDINDYWKPDAVLDIAQALPAHLELATERFGTIRIEPGCFSEILANDVLEHIPNLTGAMGAALRLLAPGGLFNIQVPYDLSWGGWQDPTHVRAFNERSWLYYTEWFWYLGWTEARFTLEKIEFVLSPIGEKLKLTCSSEELMRTPRAVDSMRVCLRKRLLDKAEMRLVTNYLKRPERTGNVSAERLSAGVHQAPEPIKITGAPALLDDAGSNHRAADAGTPRLATQVVRLRPDGAPAETYGYYDGLNEKLYAAIPPAGRILEFGCARGRLGERYKQAHPGAFWAGVDINAQALAVAAGRLDATYCINIDDDSPHDFGGSFDCIVFGDLLEHLKHPEEFLATLRSLTTSDAKLVCCVPNMGHISVIERMLMGDISYDREGLLDQTHLSGQHFHAAFATEHSGFDVNDSGGQTRCLTLQTAFSSSVGLVAEMTEERVGEAYRR